MASASDPFDGTGAVSGNWTVVDGSLSIVSGLLAGGDSLYNWMYYSGISWSENHTSKIICDTYGTDAYQMVIVRGSGSAGSENGYAWIFTQAGGNNADLYRIVNGVATKVVNLAENFGVPNPGQEAALSAEGSGTSTVIRAYIAGSEIFNFADSGGLALSGGAPGCGLFRTSSRVASWEALDDAGGGGGSAVAALAYYRKLLGG